MKRAMRRARFRDTGNRRKLPKSWSTYIRHQSRHLKPGTIIETCGCDVARIIYTDGDDLEYESLTSGHRGSCSIYNCGPVRLTEAGIQRRLDIFKKDGKKGLEMRYYIEDCKIDQKRAEMVWGEWHA